MNTLQAIQLIKQNSPAQVSAEELAELKSLIERTPSVCVALGGRPAVERFIGDVEAAMIGRESLIAVAELPLDENSATAFVAAERPPGILRRRGIELALFAAIFLIVGIWIGTILLRRGATDSVAVAEDDAAVSARGPRTPGEKKSDRVILASSGAARGTTVESEPPDVWQGWKIQAAAGARAVKGHGWDVTDPYSPKPQARLNVAGGSVTLTRHQVVPEKIHSLEIACEQTTGSVPGKLEVFVDGRAAGIALVPSTDSPFPILLPLKLAAGQAVELVLKYSPGDGQEQIRLSSAGLSTDSVDVLAESGEPDPKKTSLTIWLRADRGILDAGGRQLGQAGFDARVRTWQDQSTHVLHVESNADGLHGPTLVAADPLFGGKPTVSCAGGSLRHAGNSVYTANGSTSFAVFSVAGLARKERGRSAVVCDTSPPSAGWRYEAFHGKGRYGIAIGFDAQARVSSRDLAMGSYAVIAAVVVHGAKSFLEVNGGGRIAWDTPAIQSGDTLFVGGSHSGGSFGGNIAELIVYDRPLSVVEYRQIGRYLQSRYAIPGKF